MPHRLLTRLIRRPATVAVQTYTQRILAMQPTNLIGYWPLSESSGSIADNAEGTAARDGTYTSVTLGATGIGDGLTAATFGTGSRCDINTSSLSNAFNGGEGTLALWAQISSDVWGDGANRWLFRIERSSANNIIDIIKRNISGQLDINYKAGGTPKVVQPTGLSGITTYFHIALTWSKSADQFKAYINGAQSGSTQTGLGTWEAGTFVYGVIGALDAFSNSPHSGQLAHVALWSTPLSGSEVAAIAAPP